MAPVATPRIETFAFFCGMIYLVVGLLGFMPQALQSPAGDSPPGDMAMFHGYLLGLFDVNALHSGVHVAVGAWGICAGRSLTSPVVYGRAVAIGFAALALLGVVPGFETLFGFLPLHGHDVWLHGATAAVASYFGWHPAASVERRAGREADRRQRLEPVREERRSDRPDRRFPGSEG